MPLAHTVLQNQCIRKIFYRKKVSHFESNLMAMGDTPPIFSLLSMSRGSVPCHSSRLSSGAEVVTVSEMTVVSSVQANGRGGSLGEWHNTFI